MHRKRDREETQRGGLEGAALPGTSQEAPSARQGQRRPSGPRHRTDRLVSGPPRSGPLAPVCEAPGWITVRVPAGLFRHGWPGWKKRRGWAYSRRKQQTPLHPRPADSSTPAQILSGSHGPLCPRRGQAETRGFATTHLPTHLPARPRAKEPGVSRPKRTSSTSSLRAGSFFVIASVLWPRGAAPAASTGPSGVRGQGRS